MTKAFSDSFVALDGQYLTAAEALRQADYGKVYIMLGMNELGWVYESVFADEYGKIIDVIRESHPGAEIYVQSIIPVSRWKDGFERHIYERERRAPAKGALRDVHGEGRPTTSTWPKPSRTPTASSPPTPPPTAST